MNDDYIYKLGEHTHAKQALLKASTEARKTRDRLAFFVNRLQLEKLNEVEADHAKGWLDTLLLQQKNESFWRAEELRLRGVLAEISPPGSGA